MDETTSTPTASTPGWKKLLHGVLVGGGATTFMAAFFLVLPLIQAISKDRKADTLLFEIDSAAVPPPPPPPEEEPEEEEEEEEPEPELVEEAPPLDLSQLELALDPGFGGGWGTADFASIDLGSLVRGGSDGEGLFSLDDLDQKPRVVYQPSPSIDAKLQKRAPATVYVLFMVDASGRVESPLVQSSTDPAFERAALSAVKQWKFEPGRREGQPVRFRMRVPITFPEAD